MAKANTRKIIPPRETIEFEVGTITLMPARFEFFDSMTELINKYFSTFVDAVNIYAEKRAGIIDKYEDEKLRAEALAALDETHDANLEVARAILSTGSGAADDARELIMACVDEKRDNDLDLMQLTVVEIMILLGVAIGLNINFFNQNQEIMGLKTLFQKEETEKQRETTKTNGAKSLPA